MSGSTWRIEGLGPGLQLPTALRSLRRGRRPQQLEKVSPGLALATVLDLMSNGMVVRGHIGDHR